MNRFLFYGGTGQSKVIKSIVEKKGFNNFVVVDDTDVDPPFECDFYSGINAYENFLKNNISLEDIFYTVTIGNPHATARRKIHKKLFDDGFFPYEHVIHESAVIDEDVSLGRFLQVHAGVIVNTCSTIRDHCILNTGCSVDHDCFLSEGVELGPRATLCGEITIGENSWVGAGATINPTISIGSNCIIGSGSVVVDDIPDNSTVVGVPAKRFLKRG